MLDVRQSRELQAALLSLKQAERVVRNEINRNARAALAPLWVGELGSQATSLIDRRALLPGARVQVTDRSIRAIAAGSRRPLSGGLVPATDYGPLEWGANVKRRTVEARSPRGRGYRYARTQNRQFRPWTRQGHVVSRAAGDVVSRAVSIWVNTIVDAYRGVFEVKP